MAVSLKKRETVDLSKPQIPPKVREYTPIHLIDEEETIIRHSRQPPIQPQHSKEFEQFLEENGIKVTDDGDIRSKREDEIKAHYRSLFVRSVFALVMFCILFLIIFLFVRSSPHVNNSSESVPKDVTTSTASVENIPAESTPSDTSSSLGNVFETFVELFRSFCDFLCSNPFAILMLASTGIMVIVKTVRCFINIRR